MLTPPIKEWLPSRYRCNPSTSRQYGTLQFLWAGRIDHTTHDLGTTPQSASTDFMADFRVR